MWKSSELPSLCNPPPTMPFPFFTGNLLLMLPTYILFFFMEPFPTLTSQVHSAISCACLALLYLHGTSVSPTRCYMVSAKCWPLNPKSLLATLAYRRTSTYSLDWWLIQYSQSPQFFAVNTNSYYFFENLLCGCLFICLISTVVLWTENYPFYRRNWSLESFQHQKGFRSVIVSWAIWPVVYILNYGVHSLARE